MRYSGDFIAEHVVMIVLRPMIAFLFAMLVTACASTGAPAAPDANAATGHADAAASGDPADPTVAAAEEDDPLVCENVMRTGTRVAKRICVRRSELERHKRAADEMLGEVQRRSALSTTSEN